MRRELVGWMIGIALLTFACYLPALDAGFVWDDNDWLTENPLVRDPGALSRIWTGVERLQYYPVLFTVFRIEHALWGLDPLGYHAVNIALHAANAFLLGWLLRRLGVPGAWGVAVLFAVHPVHVESVAWVTELKNVLSGFFYLAATHCFLAFDQRRRTGPYLSALACFAAAVLTKTATATLPLALLLLLLWRRRRLSRRDLLGLAPFVLVGLALAALAVRLESGLVDVVGGDFEFSRWQRVGIAARALLFYPWKLVVPYPLIFNYPRWDLAASATTWFLPLAGCLAAAATIVLLWRRGRRGPVYALAFYAVTIAPALGMIDVYAFRYSFVADHFQYLASIGVLIVLVQLGSWIAMRIPDPGRRVPGLGAGAVVATLAILTFQQAKAYRDAPTLWRDTLAKNPESWIAHHSLALHDKSIGDHAAALGHYDDAIRSKPRSAESHTGRGQLFAARGEWERALLDLDRAIELDPLYPQARLERAGVLLASGRPDEALADLDLFLAANPSYAPARAARGRAHALAGRYDEALDDLDQAVRLAGDASFLVDRGTTLAQLGRFDEARADAEEALGRDPSDPRAFILRGMIEDLADGDRRAACSDWRRACELGACSYRDRHCR